MYILNKIKHNVYGDNMFDFFIKVILGYIMIWLLYYYLANHKKIMIEDFIIIVTLLNLWTISILLNINFLTYFLIIIFIIIFNYLFKFLIKNDPKLNKNTLVIKNGNILYRNIVENKISINDILKKLKREGVRDLKKVDLGYLYKNDLIIIRNDLVNYPISLIVDGKVMYDNLKLIKKDYNWLNHKILKHSLTVENVSYAFFKNDHLYFIPNM